MNHEFDEEMNGTRNGRSRRNPKMRDELPNTALRQSAVTSEPKAPDGSKRRVTYDGGLSAEATARIARAKRRRRIIAMIVAECLVLTVIFSYGYVARSFGRMIDIPFDTDAVKPNSDINVDTVERMKGYWTIAIFGVDDRGNVIDKNTHADVNMICSINMDSGEIKLVSVFRDSYLNINDSGSYNKLNQAYFDGGPQQAVSALNRNLDLNITHYVTFNWKTVAEGINILGGVDVELSDAEFKYINSFITETVKTTGIGSHHLKSAGMNHLDGVQAVAYGRLRKMDTDYARTERQRKVVALAFEKAKKADIGVLNNIAEVIFDDLATNIALKDILHLAININDYHLGDTIGFPMARGDANMGRKGSVVIPQTLETNVAQLHEFLYGDENYVPTDTVKNISAKIAADSGMYKEGKYIDKVPTDNGVVQPSKTAASETTTASDEDDESTSGTGSSNSSSGSSESSSTNPTRQTDANGNVILETDSNGNIITGTSGSTKPTGPSESTSETKPGSTAATSESSASYPGSGTESSASYPGSSTESSASYPGSGTESSASYPGSGTETSASGGPGSSETSGPKPTAADPTVSGGPGSGTSGNSSSQSPGSQNNEVPAVSGPGT